MSNDGVFLGLAVLAGLGVPGYHLPSPDRRDRRYEANGIQPAKVELSRVPVTLPDGNAGQLTIFRNDRGAHKTGAGVDSRNHGGHHRRNPTPDLSAGSCRPQG